MALIKCKNCGGDISDKAVKCPHCGKRVQKNKLVLLMALVSMIAVLVLGGCFGWNQYQKFQEEKRIEAEKQRQEKIDNLLAQVDGLYASFDFEGVEKCYDSLEELQYDTSKQRKILEYDKSVYEDAYAYYTAINNVNSKLYKGGYGSLESLVNTLRTPTKNFEALEINYNSEIGMYINNVRSNVMYNMFNSEYVNSTKYDLDYGLTSWGYADIIKTYTNYILEEKFPYMQTESLTVTPTATVTASQTPTEVSARFGSRTNVMKIGDSITLPYSDWNSNSDGEITVSAISNQDGKTTVKITLNSETRNNPFVILSDQLSSAYTVPAVQFLETDDPMTFVWGNGSTDDYLKANDGATIAVGSSQDIVYNTHKQYIVIVTSVLKEKDNDTTFDITSGNYNCYYTFIQLY